MDLDNISILYLFDLVKKKVDMGEFLETEAGCNIQWFEQGTKGKTICPMPNHRDGKPSFHINLVDDGSYDVWIYHCFGCEAKGTIIDFCQEYFDLNSSVEAVLFLCKKFKFENVQDLVVGCLRDVRKKADVHKKMEYSHVVVSNQCRMLLREDCKRHGQWVGAMYRKMNEALSKDDISAVEAIGYEVSRKIQER